MRALAARVSFETVRKLGLQLPDVEEGLGYGKPSLTVGGKVFACLPSHKSAGAPILPRGRVTHHLTVAIGDLALFIMVRVP